jgi:hypothetical protein
LRDVPGEPVDIVDADDTGGGEVTEIGKVGPFSDSEHA